MRRSVLGLFAVLLAFGCGPTVPPTQPEKPNPDKAAFQRARAAATVGTWDAAIAMLEGIDTKRIDDPQVFEYVEFELRCSKVAKSLGIDRQTNPASPLDVIAKIHWMTIAAEIMKKGIGEIASLAAKAKDISDQIPHFMDLDRTLGEKYGTS